MTERIISIISFKNNLDFNKPDTVINFPWKDSVKISVSNDFNYLKNVSSKHSSLSMSVDRYLELNTSTIISYDKFGDFIHQNIDTIYVIPDLKDVSCYFGKVIPTYAEDMVSNLPYYENIPFKDVSQDYYHNSVYLFNDKPIPPGEFRYTPTLDFSFNSDLIGFTGDFIKPIDYGSLLSPLSPINSVSNFPWKKAGIVDIVQDLKWGYSINNFLVGGSTEINYPIDEDAITPPIDPPTSTEVITFVNVVNIVTLPARTPVLFDNLSLSIDLDSVSWSVSFDVGNETMRDLVKPIGTTVTELEVNINGELFIVFVAKTSTTKKVSTKHVIEKRIKCTGWSVHKLLTHPYHVRRSHVETSQSTPAGLLSGELIGTGFTAVWNSASWTIPANTFTYIDKAPLAAISELAQVVGAVIIPDPASKAFTIKPRYPISPWLWSGSGADISLSENSFFSMDTEWIPQESPDSIYIYGDAATGVAVKAVRQGYAGIKTLPTVVNKYFTDTIPALERGRIEVASNGYKEVIPISTYVNPADGILKPLQLVNVTESDGITSWKAQVISVALNLKRQGNALVQSIQLEKHYDI